MKAISLAYHDVVEASTLRRTGYTGLYKLDQQQFQAHMRSIHKNEEDLLVRCIERFTEWQDKTPVFLTFDDGQLGAINYVADELERYGWRGHFFITTDWIGRPGFVDRRQIRELRSRGHVIGSHSCSHPARMSKLSWSELDKEWSESLSILSDTLGAQVRVASVPNGFYSRKVGRTAAAAGVEVLFTSEARAATSIIDGCLVLGRYFIQRNTSPEVSGAVAAGYVWPRWSQTMAWNSKKALKFMTGEYYLAIRRLVLSKSWGQGSITGRT
jgi:peptidoglycan/xylan/chitin deacetylase (PgdA/CDA1 family)